MGEVWGFEDVIICWKKICFPPADSIVDQHVVFHVFNMDPQYEDQEWFYVSQDILIKASKDVRGHNCELH